MMYTVCPKCALPLAVTAANLRAGQGYVRCGRCANVFNALLRLSDESALSAADSNGPAFPPDVDMGTASATMSRPALADVAPAEEPEAAPVAAAEPEAPAKRRRSLLEELENPLFEDPDVTNPKIGIASPEPAPAQAARSPQLRIVDTPPRLPLPELVIEELSNDEPVEEDEELVEEDELTHLRGTGTFETIVLEGDTFLQTEETIPEEVLASEIANVERRIAEAHNTAEFAALMRGRFLDEEDEEEKPEPEIVPELAALREATGEFRHEANLGVDAEDPSSWFATIRSWGDWRLTAGASALALLIVFQAINHWRDDLATQAGWFGPMRSLSSMLGEPLHPNWNLSAYDVRQLGADAAGGDDQTLRVRLSLTNVGSRPQGLPLIRLTLRDRYGKAVSRGELAPEQYLPEDERGALMIRRDQRIDTEIRVQDPTRQASSFELDVCVSAAGGGLRCAGDTPALSARSS